MSDTIVRPLAQSEAYHAMNGLYSVRSTTVTGLDLPALRTAVRALGVAYPVLCCRIDRDDSGQPVLTSHPDRAVEFSQAEGYGADRLGQLPPLTGQVAVVHVVQHDAGTSSVTLLCHHAMTDGRHMLRVLAELWALYTRVAEGDDPQPERHPLPKPIEELLAERSIAVPVDAEAQAAVAAVMQAAANAGAGETPMPQFTASPAAVHSNGEPVWQRVEFTTEQTTALIAAARAANATVGSVVSAALMLATADDTGIPVADLVHVGAVDLRRQLTPPIEPAECTNGIAAAVYAGAEPGTDLAGLARDLHRTLTEDLATGRPLKFIGMTPSLQEAFITSVGRIVGTTNAGIIPHFDRPPGLTMVDFHSMAHESNRQGALNPMFMVSTFEGRLRIESTLPEKVLDNTERRLHEFTP